MHPFTPLLFLRGFSVTPDLYGVGLRPPQGPPDLLSPAEARRIAQALIEAADRIEAAA